MERGIMHRETDMIRDDSIRETGVSGAGGGKLGGGRRKSQKTAFNGCGETR